MSWQDFPALLTALAGLLFGGLAFIRSVKADERQEADKARAADVEGRKVDLAEFESVTNRTSQLADWAVAAAERAEARALAAEERAAVAEVALGEMRLEVQECHSARDQQAAEMALMAQQIAELQQGRDLL